MLCFITCIKTFDFIITNQMILLKMADKISQDISALWVLSDIKDLVDGPTYLIVYHGGCWCACVAEELTHWGRVTHICVGKLTTIGSDNGLSPGRRQAIIWTNAGILLIRPLGTNFSEILIGIQTFSFKKMHLKMSSAKWRPFCLGLNVLIHTHHVTNTKQAIWREVWQHIGSVVVCGFVFSHR